MIHRTLVAACALASLLALVALAGCTTQTEPTAELDAELPPAAPSPRLVRLASWMTGSFSSAAQAAQHPEEYYDIRLEMVRIWPQRDDGFWLYVEQAAAETLDEPYRQRVYHLYEDDMDRLVSDVYMLPVEPLQFAGAYRNPELLGELSPDDLELRDGCSVYMVQREESFIGSTNGRSCSSNLGGAAYATSEVTLTEDALASWDRGFDFKGVQVWGSRQGPYVFDKVADYSLMRANGHDE
jgi:hypothetical protein